MFQRPYIAVSNGSAVPEFGSSVYMGLYNFKKRFAPYVLDGSKTHTIRTRRAVSDKPGNILYLYTGLRTRHTQLLGRFKCLRVEDIVIEPEGCDSLRISVNGDVLSESEAAGLAYRDGFRMYGITGALQMMRAFWDVEHGIDDVTAFEGHLIHWEWRRDANKD